MSTHVSLLKEKKKKTNPKKMFSERMKEEIR